MFETTNKKLQTLVNLSDSINDLIHEKELKINEELKKLTGISEEAKKKLQEEWKSDVIKEQLELIKTIEKKLKDIKTYEPFGVHNKSNKFKETQWFLVTLRKMNGNTTSVSSYTKDDDSKKTSNEWGFKISSQAQRIILDSNSDTYKQELIKFYQLDAQKQADKATESLSKSDLKSLDFSSINLKNDFPNTFVFSINIDEYDHNLLPVVSVAVYRDSKNTFKNQLFSFSTSSVDIKNIKIIN